MSDLKNLYDKVLNAQTAIETVKNQINEALALNTPESDEQALALEATLDAAIANEAKWANLYAKLSSANGSKDTLKNFIPVTAEDITDEAEPENKPKVINMAEWNNMTPHERLAFSRDGGRVE